MANLALPSRLVLSSVITSALHNGGYSSRMVVDAVNADLGRLEVKKEGEAKTGQIRANSKKATVLVSVSQSASYTGKLTQPIKFAAWCDLVDKAFKLCPFDSISIPVEFSEWLTFAKKKEEVENKG
jgi:hypothetical protein